MGGAAQQVGAGLAGSPLAFQFCTRKEDDAGGLGGVGHVHGGGVVGEHQFGMGDQGHQVRQGGFADQINGVGTEDIQQGGRHPGGFLSVPVRTTG